MRLNGLLPYPLCCFIGAESAGQSIAGAGELSVHIVARHGDGTALDALLRGDSKLRDVRTLHSSTPIHMAAYANRAGHVQKLLEAGTDPLLKNNVGRDAAAMARKVKADETAGVISKAAASCQKVREPRDGSRRGLPRLS